jgi:hypothetical protein
MTVEYSMAGKLLDLTQLRYAAAADDFQEAAKLLASREALARSGYLASAGLAAVPRCQLSASKQGIGRKR